jgi:hypothetical protein
MTAWIAAMFIGILVVGLSRNRSSRQAHRLVMLVIIVVIGLETAKIHAI